MPSLIKDIDVKDADGKSIPVKDGLWYSSNPATFLMSSSDVTVTPAYTDSWTAAGGLYIDMPRTGTKKVSIPAGVESFKVYDDGGKDGDYLQWSEGKLELTAPDGYALQFKGTLTGSSYYSSLTIYDGGASSTAKLLDGKKSSSDGVATDIGNIVSHGNVATLYFYASSSYPNVYSGLDLTVSVVDPEETHRIEKTSGIVGGTLTVPQNAKYGDVVNVTVVPSSGYMLTGIKVTSEGRPIEVSGGTWVDGNKASFVMPYADVTITPELTNDLSANGGLMVEVPENAPLSVTISDDVKSFKVRFGNNSIENLVLTPPTDKLFQVKGTVKLGDWSDDVFSILDGTDPLYTKTCEHQCATSKVGSLYTTVGRNLTITRNGTSGYTNPDDLDLTVYVVDPETENIIDVPETNNIVGAKTISCEPSKAKYGDVVTLTLEADALSGYYFKEVAIVSANGDTLIINTLTDNKVSFTMPSSTVSVKPRFVNPEITTFDESGALNNDTYFHMECVSGVCTISQAVPNGKRDLGDDGSVSDYNPDDNPKKWKDFKYWFRNESSKKSTICTDQCLVGSILYPCNCEYGLMDVYRAFYGNYKIKFASNLNFGGYDSGAGRCAMRFEPFTGKYVDDNGNTLYGNVIIDGKKNDAKNAVVEGMCQKDASYSGFVYANYGTQAITVNDISFTNAYVVGGNTGDVGVVAGYAGGGITLDNVKVENSTVKGADNVGGLVGYAEGPVTIKNSSFETSENGSVSGTGRGSIVGGLIGNVKTTLFEVKESFVRGNVSSGSSVGGIAGNITRTANANKNISLALSYSYSIGDITTDVTGAKIGYLIGSIDSAVTDFNTVQYNYHYGFNDAQAELGIGSFSVNGWHNPELDDDATGDYTAYYVNRNIRNAVSGLDSDGDFTLHHYPINSIAGTTYNNGVVSSSAMKTKRW